MKYTIFLLTIGSLLSCNRYIDTSTNEVIPVQQGFLRFYADSNILESRSNIVLTRDTEKVFPKAFKVALPKKIKFYEVASSTDFAFYYDNNQAILIRITLDTPDSSSNTAHVPTEKELDSFIQQSSIHGNKQFNIKNMESINNRNNKMLSKGHASILLYNILRDNDELFTNHLNKFIFLNQ